MPKFDRVEINAVRIGKLQEGKVGFLYCCRKVTSIQIRGDWGGLYWINESREFNWY